MAKDRSVETAHLAPGLKLTIADEVALFQEKSFRIFHFESEVLAAQGFTTTKYFAFWGNM